MKSGPRLALLITASPLAIIAALSQGHAETLTPHATLQGLAGGDNSQAGVFSAWFPVAQWGTSLSWVSPYYVAGNGYAAAGIGAGIRSIVAPGWALGAYGYYDGGGDTGSSWIGQGSVGVEALSNAFEARANGYFSFGGTGGGLGYSPTATLNAENMLVLSHNYRVGEDAVDGEVGARLIQWGNVSARDGLRGFAGAWAAWHDGETETGIKGRLEARFTSAEHAALTISGGMSYANDASAQWSALVGLSIPLGAPGTGGGGSDGDNLPPMDADAVHHLGPVTAAQAEEEAAYFTDGRATGKVEYADGVANGGNDGLTEATATSLVKAVGDVGENGIIVALGGATGDIQTTGLTGQTLQNGQALLGGGGTLQLANANGDTGFSWTAGGTQGTIAHTGEGYALTLGNNNTVVDVGVSSTETSTSTIEDHIIGGIDGSGSDHAYIAGTTVDVTVTGTGEAGDDDDQTGNAGVTAHSYAGDAGISHLVTNGIDLAHSSHATLADNTVTVSVTGTGGKGGDATGGGNTSSTGGDGLGAAGGIGLEDTKITGVALDYATNADAHHNTVTVTATGNGGVGGAGTGGTDVGSNGQGGTGLGGAGGDGVNGVTVTAVSAAYAQTPDIQDNIISATLDGFGGKGGAGTGGDGYEDGGQGTGGDGNNGINNSSLTGLSIALATNTADVENNTITVTTTAKGGDGGKAMGGNGVDGASDSDGGFAQGEYGGNGAQSFTTTGIDAHGSDAPNLSGNSVTITQTATGAAASDAKAGDGGDSVTNDGGSTRQTVSGGGGDGLYSGTTVAINVANVTGTATIDSATINLTVTATGGSGGTQTGGDGGDGTVGADANTVQGANGGDGLQNSLLTAINANTSILHLSDTTITATLTAAGGAGGDAFGGKGGDGASDEGGNGGYAAGGNGGYGMVGSTFTGLNLGSAPDGTLADSTIDLTLHSTGGDGGIGTGGNGGSTESGNAALGGNGTGGAGGHSTTYSQTTIIDASGSAGVEMTDVSTSLTADSNGGAGGKGTGGDGGDKDGGGGGAGGSGTGGDGGSAGISLVGENFETSNNLYFTSPTATVTLVATAGDGGDATGGTGGDATAPNGGSGGNAQSGKGGDVTPITLTGISISNSNFAHILDTTATVSFTGVGGDAGAYTIGVGGTPGGATGSGFGNTGGDGDTTLTGVLPFYQLGAFGQDLTGSSFTLDSGSSGTNGSGN